MQEIQPLNILLLLLFILASAFFSGTEAAFLSSQRHRLRQLSANGSKTALIADKFLDEPEKFLSVVLVGNNLFNTAAAALMTAVAMSIIGPKNAVIFGTIATTIILLLAGEITPKTIAARYPEKVLILIARPFQIIRIILIPISLIFTAFSHILVKSIGGKKQSVTGTEELKSLVNVGVEEGTVEENEANLVRKAFLFGDRMVREIMTPRNEIIWIKSGTTFNEFLEIYTEHSYSFFPIQGEKEDEIIGVLSIKDVMGSHALGKLNNNSPVTQENRVTYFVPETKKIGELLEELKVRRNRLALVIDEFGDVSGLVTLSRVVEELVGKVEEPGEPSSYIAVDERTVVVDGSLHIGELEEQLNIHLPDGDGQYETVAGFMLRQLEHIPTAGELVIHEEYRLTVKTMNGPRIDEVVIQSEFSG
jgi:CBS domain containing-hemolysin-like protein